MLIINDVHELVALADEIAMVEGVDGRTALRTALQVWPTVHADPGDVVPPPTSRPPHADRDALQARVRELEALYADAVDHLKRQAARHAGRTRAALLEAAIHVEARATPVRPLHEAPER